jgi:hypothetical protein
VLARTSYKDERERNGADKREPWREWRCLAVDRGLDQGAITEEPFDGRYETPNIGLAKRADARAG